MDLLRENRVQKRLKKNLEFEETSNDNKKFKKDLDEFEGSAVKMEGEERRHEIKHQPFEKIVESAPIEEDGKDRNMREKFVTMEIDDLFGTKLDQEIVEKDVPERLQIKLNGRFNPSEMEIELEAKWIFNIIIDSLDSSKDVRIASKIQEIEKKIHRVLRMLRCEYHDIPFITKYRMNELIPELQPQDVYHIFELDIEYGKFQIQKKIYEEFFSKLSEFGTDDKIFEHYKNQIFYTKSMRDLKDFVPLINFYKSYYQKELEQAIQNSGKKVPVQKKDLVYNARQQKLDEFSSKCMLHSIHLLENMHENNQIHKPNNPQNIGPKDMAREYIKIDS